jgi:GAF domain-containing protein
MLGEMPFDATEERSRLEADARYLAFLVQAGEMLSASLDYRETLQNLCRAAVATVADICLIDLGELGNTQLVSAAHRDCAIAERIAAEHVGKHLISAARFPMHPVCRVIESGETFYAPHIDDAWIDCNASRPEHAQFMRAMQYESMIVVPVRSTIYGITGALTLVTTKNGRPPLNRDGVAFAEDLGRRCGAAIGKARIYEQAVEAAIRFQEAALPRALPHLSHFTFDALYQPATSALLIGGDWYDAFTLPDGRVAISIGDVSGHGLEAAVSMASMKNSLRTALLVTPDLLRALDAGDQVFRSENTPDHFCTAMAAVLDPHLMTLTCAPAGHPGPKIWMPETGEVADPFVSRGLPLGARDLTIPVTPRAVTLTKGTFAVFYTDGLVESQRNLIEGERALEAAILREDVRSAANPARAIRDAVLASQSPTDDLAILTVQVK